MSHDHLQELLDKQALTELIHRVALALDKRDWAAYRACLLDVVHFDFTPHTDRVVGKNIGVVKSGDEWVAKLRWVMPGFDSSQHLTTNVVHVLDGDVASSECFIVADHFLNNEIGERTCTMGGIYRWKSARTAEGWKIHEWYLTPLWYRGNPAVYQIAAERAAALENPSP
jgi:hypothetical protein